MSRNDQFHPPTPLMDAAIQVEDMVRNSERSMEQRLGGRPRLSDEEKRRAVNVTLSPEAIATLNGWTISTGKSRSELLENMVRHTAVKPEWPEEISGIPAAPAPLSDAELAAVAKIASDSISAWAMSNAKSTVAEIGEAVHTLYAAAVAAVRENR